MGMRFFVLLCFTFCGSSASDLAGPTLGLVFDPSHGLLPIRGSAGAATLGDPLDLGAGVLLAAGRNIAVVSSDSGVFVASGAIRTAVPPADLIALSPEESAAALYDRGAGRIRVVTGLPREANLARETDLSPYAGELTSIAVSDDGSALIAGFLGAVVLFQDDSARILTAPSYATSAAFLSGSHDALIADREGRQVYIIRGGEPALLSNDVEAIAVAASRDRKRAFLASPAGIMAIDLASGGASSIPCACQPVEIAPLAGNAVFRLTGASSGPVWLLDADRDEPATVFVPRYRIDAGVEIE